MGPLRRSGFPPPPPSREALRGAIRRVSPRVSSILSHCDRGSVDRGSRACGTVPVHTVRYTACFPVIQSRPRRESRVRAPDKIVIDGTRDRYFAPRLSSPPHGSLCAGKIGRFSARSCATYLCLTYLPTPVSRGNERAAGVIRAIIKL